MKGKKLVLSVVAAVSSLIPLTVAAHPLVGDSIGFMSGLVHPLFGADHALAMLAVGLWLARQSRRAVRYMPVAFAVLMVLGGSVASGSLLYAEHVAAFLLMMLGLMVVSAFNVNGTLGGLLISGFAVFHGYAHGADMLLDTEAHAYSAGFVVATLGLLFAGIGLGGLFRRWGQEKLYRLAGGMSALAGVWVALQF